MTAIQRHFTHRAIRAVAGRRGNPTPEYLAELFGESIDEIMAALAGGES